MAIARTILATLAIGLTLAASACARETPSCNPATKDTVRVALYGDAMNSSGLRAAAMRAAASERSGAIELGRQLGAILELMQQPACASDMFADGWPNVALRTLAQLAVERLDETKRTEYLLAAALVYTYASGRTATVPSPGEYESSAKRLFDEVYWNTVDPRMELRTSDGGRVEPLTSVEEYQTLRSQLSVIHTDIERGIKTAATE